MPCRDDTHSLHIPEVSFGTCENSFYFRLESDLSLLHGSVRHPRNFDCGVMAPTQT